MITTYIFDTKVFAEVKLSQPITIRQQFTGRHFYFKEYPVAGYCLTVCGRENNFTDSVLNMPKERLTV